MEIVDIHAEEISAILQVAIKTYGASSKSHNSKSYKAIRGQMNKFHHKNC